MISSVTHSSATLDYKPSFWRELLDTTAGYMAWGYGALLFSLAAFGSYLSFKWIARNPDLLMLTLTVLVLALAVISRLRLDIRIRTGTHEIAIGWGTHEKAANSTNAPGTQAPL